MTSAFSCEKLLTPMPPSMPMTRRSGSMIALLQFLESGLFQTGVWPTTMVLPVLLTPCMRNGSFFRSSCSVLSRQSAEAQTPACTNRWLSVSNPKGRSRNELPLCFIALGQNGTDLFKVFRRDHFVTAFVCPLKKENAEAVGRGIPESGRKPDPRVRARNTSQSGGPCCPSARRRFRAQTAA